MGTLSLTTTLTKKNLKKKMKSAFKNGKPFQDRVRDAAQIRHEHPDKTPIIVERAHTEKNLPMLDKTKFLVPAHVTVHEFTRVLRRRLELSPGQASCNLKSIRFLKNY